MLSFRRHGCIAIHSFKQRVSFLTATFRVSFSEKVIHEMLLSENCCLFIGSFPPQVRPGFVFRANPDTQGPAKTEFGARHQLCGDTKRTFVHEGRVPTFREQQDNHFRQPSPRNWGSGLWEIQSYLPGIDMKTIGTYNALLVVPPSGVVCVSKTRSPRTSLRCTSRVQDRLLGVSPRTSLRCTSCPRPTLSSYLLLYLPQVVITRHNPRACSLRCTCPRHGLRSWEKNLLRVWRPVPAAWWGGEADGKSMRRGAWWTCLCLEPPKVGVGWLISEDTEADAHLS